MTSDVGFTKLLVGGGTSVPQGRRRRLPMADGLAAYVEIYKPRKSA
jgi:hypothetical protein